MLDTKLGIVIAMPSEAKVFRTGKLPVQQVIPINDHINIYISGIGREFARDGGKALILAGATHLLSWGLAGGLNPNLKTGDIILASSIHNGEDSFPINSNWLLNNLPEEDTAEWQAACLLSNMPMITSTEDKQAWHKKTNADIVDMESYSVAKLAEENNLPFAAIRFVIDSVEMQLPDVVVEHTDNFGHAKISALIKAGINKPSVFKELLELGLAANKATKIMREVSQTLLKHIH